MRKVLEAFERSPEAEDGYNDWYAVLGAWARFTYGRLAQPEGATQA